MVPDRFAPLLAELAPLADRFRAADRRLYLVGGTVRDLLVGRESDGDVDATTDARPDEIKAILDGWAHALWTQGERFGTIGAAKPAGPTRSPPTAPRPTRRIRASPTSCSPTPSRSTCPAATSP